jgi:hypothetical protein
MQPNLLIGSQMLPTNCRYPVSHPDHGSCDQLLICLPGACIPLICSTRCICALLIDLCPSHALLQAVKRQPLVVARYSRPIKQSKPLKIK